MSNYISGGVYGAFAKGSQIVGRFAQYFLLIRIMGSRLFGVFVLTETILRLCVKLLDFGMSQRILQQVSNDQDRSETFSHQVFGLQFMMTVLVSSVVFLVAPYAAAFFDIDALGGFLKGMGWALPGMVLCYSFAAYYEGRGKVNHKHFLETIQWNWIFLAVVGTVWLVGGSWYHVVAGYVLSRSIPPLFYLLFKDIQLGIGINQIKKRDLSFGSHMVLSNVAKKMLWEIDVLFVSYFLGGRETGAYKIAVKIAKLIRVVDNLTTPIFRPRIPTLLKNSRRKFLTEFHSVTRVNLIGALAGLAVLLAFGTQILEFFGDYQSYYHLTILLGLVFGMVSSFGNVGNVLILRDLSKSVLAYNLTSLLINVILNLFLVPKFGVAGAAMATGTGLLVSNFLSCFQNWYYLHLVLLTEELFLVIGLCISYGVINTGIPGKAAIVVFWTIYLSLILLVSFRIYSRRKVYSRIFLNAQQDELET